MASLKKARTSWVSWLRSFGAGRFFDAFVAVAQGAEGTCINCRQPIYLDIVEGGGAPDWKTIDGDYGCERSPDTTEEATGGHEPRKE